MCHILSCYFLAVYGVFEQQRLVSDFADVLDAQFLIEEARMYFFVSLYAEVGQK